MKGIVLAMLALAIIGCVQGNGGSDVVKAQHQPPEQGEVVTQSKNRQQGRLTGPMILVKLNPANPQAIGQHSPLS